MLPLGRLAAFISLATWLCPAGAINAHQNCTTSALLSGIHGVTDEAFGASSVLCLDFSDPSNSRLNWTGVEGRTAYLYTKDEYNYQRIPNADLRRMNSLTFSVRACNDVHLTLQTSQTIIDPNSYEIVIGGWGNSMHVLRRVHQDQILTSSQSVLLSCTFPRLFWISWDSKRIAVGTGGIIGQGVFLSYNNPPPLNITSAAISTGFGATGNWTFYNVYGNRSGAWVPLLEREAIYNYTEWIEVDLSRPVPITGIATQGRSDEAEWVTEYILMYKFSISSDWYKCVDGTGSIRIFTANRDQNSLVQHVIDPPFEARYVRLAPTKAYVRPSLRWELYGCLPQSDWSLTTTYPTLSSSTTGQTQEAICLAQGGVWCRSFGGLGICAPDSWRCNGNIDCIYGEDESQCTTEELESKCLLSGRYFCKISRQCVPKYYRCNGRRECSYGEDETTCPQTPSPSSQCLSQNGFWCRESFKCVIPSAKCNGVKDCYFGEDETSCPVDVYLIIGGVCGFVLSIVITYVSCRLYRTRKRRTAVRNQTARDSEMAVRAESSSTTHSNGSSVPTIQQDDPPPYDVSVKAYANGW